MNERLRTAIIGLFVVGAFTTIGMILLFLKPSFGDDKLSFKLRFTSIEKIGVGTRVTLAGKPIGQVKEIHSVEDARETSNPSSGVYAYELVLCVDSKTPIYFSDSFLSQTSGLLGERTIAIIPQHAKLPLKPLQNGDLVYAAAAGGVEDTVERVSDITIKAQETVENLCALVRVNSEPLTKSIGNLSSASEGLKKIVDKIENEKFVENLAKSVRTTSSAMEKVDLIAQEISSGKGTIGKLLMKDDLYLDVAEILARINVLLSDINNYGLLFHNSRTWKMQRAYQMDRLVSVKDADSFRKFWKDRLEGVYVELGQMSDLIQRASKQSKSFSDDQEGEFKEVLKKALQELSNLQNQLCLIGSSLEAHKSN